ncbi:hypothetical protein ACFM35_00085 [Microbacterium sp. P01]|uniref:hypothetical protein n=1 Tax=Microbacterium sp. P01 TaxID=3366261 RepID=UPI00366DA367
MTEQPAEVILTITGASGADTTVLRAIVTQHIRQAAGSRAAAARLVITWTEPSSVLPTTQ